ncbi:MAG: DNA-binding protein WhiA [Lachnospiraceae bacterium]|nr:DNA-binding protein WhiA [Lachnospiraceae bacterium]
MSFSHSVKEELAKHTNIARHCRVAELSAILHFCGQYGKDKDGVFWVGFQTENESTVTKAFTLLKKAFNIEADCPVEEEELELLFETMGDLSEPVDESLLRNNCCKRAFLRGAFLGVGSMSDPEKGYHLEFVCTDEAKALQLQEIIGEFHVDAKIIIRKKYFVVYIKESESIVELLNIMEAPVALMNLENLRILKDMRNSINRKVNCEAANINKTVSAANRQIEDIEYLRDHYGLQNLQPSLRQMAEVRLEYPEASLKELGELLDPKVGKSGVNHRLRKLSELAEKMRT